MKKISNCLWNLFKKRVRKFVRYPQYSLIVIECIFFFLLIGYNIKLLVSQILNFEQVKSILNIKFILNIVIIGSLLWGLGVAILKFWFQKDLDYGGIYEQLNDTGGKGEDLKNSIPKVLKHYYCYFLSLAIFLICYNILLRNNILSIGMANINELGIYFTPILIGSELLINMCAFSPFLFIIIIVGLPTLVNSIGKDSAFLNWTFLTFVLATFIGSNFFDESLVKGRFSEKLSKEKLILRKISFFIGVIFLLIGILSSDFVINSTSFKLFVNYIKSTNGSVPFIEYFDSYMKLLVKGLALFFVFNIYLGTEKKIMYHIFRFYYRDMELKKPRKLVEVRLDKKNWRIGKIGKKGISPSCLKNLKRISLDTYQIEGDNNIYYVNKNSEIPKKIQGLDKNKGNYLLGVLDLWTKSSLAIMIVLLSIIYIFPYIIHLFS